MKAVLWFTCLIFFTIFTVLVYVRAIVKFPFVFVIKYLTYIQRSCDWYTKRNIFPWEAAKAKAIHTKELEAMFEKHLGKLKN